MKNIKKEASFSYAVIYSCSAGAVWGLMMVIGYAMYHYYEYYDKLVLDISLESGEKTHYFSSSHFYMSAISLMVLLTLFLIFTIRSIICLKRYVRFYLTFPAILILWAVVSGATALAALILLHPIIFPY